MFPFNLPVSSDESGKSVRILLLTWVLADLPVEFLNCAVVRTIYLVFISEGYLGAGHRSRVLVKCGCGLVLGLGGGEVGVGVVKGQVNL